jgi:pilus assembly protein Flp/PilA
MKDMGKLARFVRDEEGATAIEYGLVATFIAMACLATIQMLGATVLSDLYESIVAAFT